MAATSTLTLRVKTIGDRSIDSVTRKLLKLQTVIQGYNAISTRSLQATNVRWKQHFDAVDKGIKMFGGALIKLVTKSAKLAALEIGLLGAAMMGVHAAFVLGNGAMKAFRWLATGAAGAVAALTIAASTAAAAIREQQMAMYAFKGGGNYQAASVLMRQLASDADMASVGAENLQAAFAAVSKTSTFTAGSANLLKGLMDFASAGKPLEEGVKAAGDLIAKLQDPKATFGQISEAAKALGPEMEKALAEAGGKGIKTAEQLKKAILDGTLSAAGGVQGQFDAVNGTLISRFKATFAIIKNDFADFGEPFLKPVKDLLEDISRTFKRTFDRVSGEIAMFANAGFFEEIGGFTEKISDFFVNFIRDYLPKVDGMFSSLGSWWDRFKEGWNMILDKLRPLIAGAKVFEETLMRVLRPIGAHLSEAFGGFNEQIVANEEKFYAFGDAVGQFIGVISKYAKTVREIFIDALPFITKIINGLTGIVDLFMSLLGGFRDLFGGGGLGSFMLIAKLLVGGRAMKKTPGGVLASYGMKDITNAGGGPLTGQTPDGNVTEGARDRAKRLAKVAGAIQNQSVARMNVANMTVMSQSDKATASARAQQQQQKREANREKRQANIAAAKAVAAQQKLEATGTSMRSAGGSAAAVAAQTRLDAARIKYESSGSGISRWRAGREYRRAAKANFEANRGTITLPQYSPYGNAPDATYKNNFFTRNFRMSSEARAQMKNEEMARRAAAGVPMGPMAAFRGFTQKGRQMRDSYGYKMIFGGNVGTKDNPVMKKGINNSMMAGMGASLGLGLLSNVMPQESQGALALGSSIAMVNPLAGLAVGVIGGAIMGIRGAAKRKKKEAIAEAKKQAQEFMEGVVGSYQDKMRQQIQKGTLTKESVENLRQTRRTQFADRQRQLDAIIMGTLNARGRASLAVGSGNTSYGPGGNLVRGASNAKDLARLDLQGYDIMDSDALKDMAKRQKMTGTGIFGSLSDEAYKEAMKNPDAFIAAQREINEVQAQAFDLVTQFGDQRAGSIASSLGKTELEIRRLADATGVNLHDSAQTTREQVMKLAEAMVNTTQKLRNATADTFATGTDVFRKQREANEAETALKDQAFAARGQINEFLAGNIFDANAQKGLNTDLLTFFENFRQNLGTYYGGDMMLADQEFNRLFGRGGAAFTQEGGTFQGQEALVYASVGEQLDKTVDAGRQSGISGIEEFLRANFLESGFQLDGNVNAIAQGLYGMDSTNRQAILDRIENANLQDPGVQSAILELLQSRTGVTDITAAAYVEPQLEAATKMAEAAELFKGSVMSFQEASGLIIAELGGDGDRRSPFGGIGDSLSSSMGRTLSNHSAINSGLPGRRTITSGYRDYALGSLKSDHVTGRALDIVGDNLVSYRDRMTAAGGLAEFHGKGDSRHLHVVPPQSGRIGDSMTAVSATSSSVYSVGGRGSSVSNTNNFYITGTNANEIAEAVMTKMAMVNKSNEERR